MKPFLSICMIVKNEENLLRRCLDSIKGIADEIIIADTGSVDKTKDIALEYTDMVFDYTWEDDFSKARNFAASKASGEWIFVIDADEFVDRDSFIKFKEELKNNPPDYNILAVQIVNFVGLNGKDTSLNYHERLYKNDGLISYYRSIHELLKHKESKERRGFSDFQIYHSGYMKNIINEKEKSNRNLTLLKKKKEKEPIDYYFLGNEYDQLGDLDKAIKYYQKGFQLKDDLNKDWVKKLLLRLVNTLHKANRNKEALEIIDSCEQIYPYLVDFKFYRGKIHFDEEDYENAKEVFEEILRKKNELKADSSNDFLEYLPYKLLGEIYESENELHLAVHNYSRALSINDADDYVWSKLINLLAKHSPLDELTEFLNNNLLTKNNITPQRVIKILLDVPDLNAQKLTRSLLDESELSIDEKEALFIKNLCLDGNTNEVVKIIAEKSPSQIYSLLTKGIFTIIDFIILTIELQSQEYQKMLYDIKFDKSINNLFHVLFNKKHKKLDEFEEELFVSILKQANVLGWETVINHLNSKMKYLSLNAKTKLKKIEKQIAKNAAPRYVQYENNQENRKKEIEEIKKEIENLLSNQLYEEALTIVDESLKSAPSHVELYSIKAVILINMQQLDRAIEVLEKGLEIDPNHVDCLYNLAYIHEQNKNVHMANKVYEKILGLTNDEEIIKEIKDQLNKHDKKKILVGSPIHQKPQILKYFLKSLSRLDIEGIELHFLFIDDNDQKESSLLLEEFSKAEKNVVICKSDFNDKYERNNQTHFWNEYLIWKVANFKDSIIQIAKEFNFDYLFLIDSDLVLHPYTLQQLLKANKDIISNIFWTKWQPDFPALPQVWMFDQYEQYIKFRGEQLSKEQIIERHKDFVETLKKPGVYEVGGLGACTLISKKAIKAGVNFSEIKNISFWGEDRHFCIRAQALGFDLFVDTHYPAFHIYRDSDLRNVEKYMESVDIAYLFRN